jgi:Condensation domain
MTNPPKTCTDGSVSVGNHPIPRRGETGPCPLSFVQERLWFLNQLRPDSSAYNQPKAIRLAGSLNVSALKQALDAIIARHEALRTTIVTLDGRPVQMIGPGRSIELTITDLTPTAVEERQAKLDRCIREITNRPFNLSRDLMLRAALFYLGEDHHILLLVTHHIASDGWSMGVLFQELAALYDAYSASRPSPLPELPIQYSDYAIWQHERFEGHVLERHLSYWKQKLTGISPQALPTDRPRAPIQTFGGARKSLMLSQRVSDALKALSRSEKATLFMVLLAAFKTLLNRYTGHTDIVVGTPIAGRSRMETQGLIGFLVDTLVLRTDLSQNPTFRELLKRVRQVCLEAYAHRDLPSEKLISELQLARSLSQNTLFQVMFNLRNYPRPPIRMAGLTIAPVEVSTDTSKFDLTLAMSETGQGLSGSLEYNTDLFDGSTIDRLLGHFQNLIAAVVGNPDQPISELPLMTEAEEQRLISDFNQAT